MKKRVTILMLVLFSVTVTILNWFKVDARISFGISLVFLAAALFVLYNNIKKNYGSFGAYYQARKPSVQVGVGAIAISLIMMIVFLIVGTR